MSDSLRHLDADSVLRPFEGGSLDLSDLHSSVQSAIERVATNVADAAVEAVSGKIAEALRAETEDLRPTAYAMHDAKDPERRQRLYAVWESRTTGEPVRCNRPELVRVDVIRQLLDGVQESMREGWRDMEDAVQELKDVEKCLQQAIREVSQAKQELTERIGNE